LTALCEKYTFKEVADILQAQPSSVARWAKECGIEQRWCRRGTEEESARILQMAADGMSTKAIAKALGRSQGFVKSRIDGKGAEQVDRTPIPVPSRPTVRESVAMRGVRFEDVPLKKGRWSPLNGAAATSHVQAACQGHEGAAAMCVD